MAIEIAEKCKTGATGERARGETKPGNNAHPVQFAFAGSEQHENEGKRAGKRERGVQAPANSGGVAKEHVRKPHGNSGRADVHEEAKSKEITDEREMPPAAAQKPFHLRDEQRYQQISDKKRSGAARGKRR